MEIERSQQLEKIIQVQKIIKRYVNGRKDDEGFYFDQSAKKTQSLISMDEFGNELAICAKDIILHPFMLQNEKDDSQHDIHSKQAISEEKRFSKISINSNI